MLSPIFIVHFHLFPLHFLFPCSFHPSVLSTPAKEHVLAGLWGRFHVRTQEEVQTEDDAHHKPQKVRMLSAK